MIPGKV